MAPGQVAEDGTGANSAYTKALSLAIRRPGATVEQVFKRVRIEVMSRTLDEQVPWESSSLTGDFYFSGGAPTSQASVATVPALQSAPQISMEAIFWQSIQDSEDAGAFKAYLEQYPSGSFAALARFKAKKYQETEVAVAVPRTTSGQRSIDVLKGYKIWIRSDKGEIGRGYCQRLEDAGLIVECDPNETNDPMEDVMLKCATLPADSGEILQEFLGIDSLFLYDWREHEDYGAKSGGYCDEYDAITIDSFANKDVSLGSIDNLRGSRIWVRGNGGENIERYCQRLTEAGLIVRCLPDDEHDPENDIVLACATLPSDTGEILQEYLGISGYKIYDWREHEDYGASSGGYCNEFNAIDISTYD